MDALAASTSLRGLTLALAADWATTLSLIFGGCCSNALTLEQLTRAHPHSGALITLAQFALVALHGLPAFLVLSRPFVPFPHALPSRRVRVPRLRARRVPLAPYAAQVALFYAVSLLNGRAFAYRIPMPVHIIFRSGGLVVSMLMGWAVAGKRYNLAQVASVLVVTAGVVLTTLSASKPQSKAKAGSADADASAGQYATGIAMLTLALILGGALGLVQDWTYARYAREMPAAKEREAANGHAAAADKAKTNGKMETNGHAKPVTPANQEKEKEKEEGKEEWAGIAPWQESMFYLHFLSLPMFLFVQRDIAAQFAALRASPPLRLSVRLPFSLPFPLPASLTPILHPPIGLTNPLAVPSPPLSLSLPSAYVPFALNALTSLVCVAGVNRLTARVSSLTVTLVLVVRKAVSMLISVVLFSGSGTGAGETDARLLWAGAACVFLGTMGYAAGSRKGKKGKGAAPQEKTKKE